MLVTIAAMLSLAAFAGVLLTRMLKTIRDLRGVTTGLNDTLRWTLGKLAAESSATGRDGSPR